MLNFVHGDKYSVALELARKFTVQGKNQTRPVLHYVRHTENGRMEATDSHRAVMFHNMHGFEKDYLVHPKTFNVATGKFPDLLSLFDTSGHEHVVTLSKEQITLWLQLFRSINNTLKTIKSSSYGKVVHLLFKADRVKVRLYGLDVNMELPATVHKQDYPGIAVNAEFIRDAMEVFSKMEANEIKIRLRGPIRVMHFEDEGKTEVIVLPQRHDRPIEE